jgi:hypothetical protein
LNVATGYERRVQVEESGELLVEGLPPGRYRLFAERQGFSRQVVVVEVRSRLQVADPVILPIVFQVGRLTFDVEVVASAPLPGGELESWESAPPVSVSGQEEIRASQSLSLADFLDRRLGGVNLNEIQGNPYQADLNYRGYTASPLLGTPQGISVYFDGVRINQPFGDIVSWDLIPQQVIAEVLPMLPGSNPMFGLNTLGGALVIRTKDGQNSPGTAIGIGGEFRSSDRRRPGARRLDEEWLSLVSGKQSLLRKWLADRFPLQYSAVFRQAGVAAWANDDWPDAWLRQQRDDWEWIAGDWDAGA